MTGNGVKDKYKPPRTFVMAAEPVPLKSGEPPSPTIFKSGMKAHKKEVFGALQKSFLFLPGGSPFLREIASNRLPP